MVPANFTNLQRLAPNGQRFTQANILWPHNEQSTDASQTNNLSLDSLDLKWPKVHTRRRLITCNLDEAPTSSSATSLLQNDYKPMLRSGALLQACQTTSKQTVKFTQLLLRTPFAFNQCTAVPIGNKQSISRKPVATFPSLRDLDKIFGALASARTQRMSAQQTACEPANSRFTRRYSGSNTNDDTAAANVSCHCHHDAIGQCSRRGTNVSSPALGIMVVHQAG